MAITNILTITGVTKNIQPGWSLEATANGRNTFNFSIISLDGSYRPALDDDVIFYESVSIVSSSVASPSVITTLEDHGLVTGQSVEIAGHTGSSPSINRLHTITRTGNKTFTIPVNVTVSGTGGTATRRLFGGNIILPSEAGLGGYGVVPIVINISAADYNMISERRYIKTTIFSGLSPAIASNGMLGISSNFPNDAQIVLGTQTYVMKTVLTNVAGYVQIDAVTMNGSLQNLAAAINRDPSQAGTAYAAATVINEYASAYVRGNALSAIARVAGVAGNSIPISSTHGTCYGQGGIPLSYLQSGAESSGTANKLKAVLSAIISLLDGEGIILHPDQVEGPDIPYLNFDYLLLREVLDQLSVLSNGYIWHFDEYCRLSMINPSGNSAPFNITSGDGHVLGDITVEPTRTDYANRVILRFSDLAVAAWGYLGVTVNFPINATVKIGSTTYTFVSPLTDTAGFVLIGGSIIDSLNNLAAAVTLGSGKGTVYADKTVINASAYCYTHAYGYLVTKAITPGAAGNSIEVTTSWGDSFWYHEGGGGISTLEGGADSALRNTVYADDIPEQTAHGVWEIIIEAKDTTDAGIAQTTANAYLAVKKLVPRTVNYETRDLGLVPGQTQTITIAARGLNSTFMITDVNTNHVVGNFITRSVTLIENLILQSTARWRDTYKQWSGGGGGSSGTAVSGISPSSVIMAGIYAFGGSNIEWVQSSGPTWIPANSIQIQIDTAIRGSVIGTCFVRLRSISGNVTARLINLTDNLTVGTSSVVTSTSFQTTSFGVNLTSGSKLYEIQLLPSVANVDVQLGSSYLE